MSFGQRMVQLFKQEKVEVIFSQGDLTMRDIQKHAELEGIKVAGQRRKRLTRTSPRQLDGSDRPPPPHPPDALHFSPRTPTAPPLPTSHDKWETNTGDDSSPIPRASPTDSPPATPAAPAASPVSPPWPSLLSGKPTAATARAKRAASQPPSVHSQDREPRPKSTRWKTDRLPDTTTTRRHLRGPANGSPASSQRTSPSLSYAPSSSGSPGMASSAPATRLKPTSAAPTSTSRGTALRSSWPPRPSHSPSSLSSSTARPSGMSPTSATGRASQAAKRKEKGRKTTLAAGGRSSSVPDASRLSPDPHRSHRRHRSRSRLRSQ